MYYGTANYGLVYVTVCTKKNIAQPKATSLYAMQRWFSATNQGGTGLLKAKGIVYIHELTLMCTMKLIFSVSYYHLFNQIY